VLGGPDEGDQVQPGEVEEEGKVVGVLRLQTPGGVLEVGDQLEWVAVEVVDPVVEVAVLDQRVE
jgi:hypothetical protein